VGCKSGYGGGKTHLFKAPANCDKQLWLSNIPKRQDSLFGFNKSVLCKKHFDFSQIKVNKRTTSFLYYYNLCKHTILNYYYLLLLSLVYSSKMQFLHHLLIILYVQFVSYLID
jgi:THAP domain